MLNNQISKTKLFKIKSYCEILYSVKPEKKYDIEELYYDLLIKIVNKKFSNFELKSFSEKLLSL